jgi:hypothetical protein
MFLWSNYFSFNLVVFLCISESLARLCSNFHFYLIFSISYNTLGSSLVISVLMGTISYLFIGFFLGSDSDGLSLVVVRLLVLLLLGKWLDYEYILMSYLFQYSLTSRLLLLTILVMVFSRFTWFSSSSAYNFLFLSSSYCNFSSFFLCYIICSSISPISKRIEAKPLS